MLAIGLMSGTSVDGLDIALVDIKGCRKQTKVKLVHFETTDFEKELKEKIFVSFKEKVSSRFLCSLNFEIGKFFGDSVNNFLKKYNILNSDISFIASHGQTIYHLVDPNEKEMCSTLQLGDISVIANITNIDVVGDFRTADMSVGGFGAPLVSYPDYLLFSNKDKIRLLQNIGGISNVSVIENDNENVIAFDNGPGNVLIDFAIKKFYGLKYDNNGENAFNGKVNQELIDYLLMDDYYNLLPPKTTGREKYSRDFFEAIISKFNHLSKNDILTSLTYFTAYVIADSYKKFIIKNDKQYEVFLSGGGAKNKFILESLQKLLPNIKVSTVEELGWNVDAKEAIEFAILGHETLHRNPGNLTSVTNAKRKVILGKVAYAYKGK